MALTDNLVSYWKLDESSGNAADSVDSNTLTDNNTVTYGAAKINNGALFDFASTESLSIADASQTGLDFTADFSFSFWVKIPAFSGVQIFTLITKFTNAPNRQYATYLVSDGSTFWNWLLDLSFDGTNNVFPDPSLTGLSFGTIPTDTWTYMVVTWQGSTGASKFYINGSSAGTGTGTNGSLFNGTSAFQLGISSTWAGSTASAYMDEVGVWSRILTPAEVTTLYHGGAGLSYPFIPFSPFPSHYNVPG
jgi:hypothetical protein